ncbi:hypothetical protein SAMN06265219_112159 [Gracilimonas mengyeensis]|uniref:Uncharacterized protein n=1 Tax=Gracilimonas mengyeensis TaxID=1302730 RepID=A0A521EMF1_9BACT|nr:hypothetical protein SAMN06265219_112159 [Gracilimonas mengyeensis]
MTKLNKGLANLHMMDVNYGGNKEYFEKLSPLLPLGKT